MNFLERFYPESRFGGFSDIDGNIAFYTRVQAMLVADSTVLDVGCGRGAGLVVDHVNYRKELRNLRGKCKKVIGLDVDPKAKGNPGVDEFHLIDNKKSWPIDDESIDLVVSDFVLEHIEVPGSFFQEVTRVLKPGGIFCARTSNRFGYVGMLAKIIPRRFHGKILGVAQKGRNEIDVFQTYFRVNTVWKARLALKAVGLEGIAYGYEAEPSYLEFSSLVYAIGKVLHEITPSFLRTCLFVFARKPLR